jgi:phosphoesterase RecJ-like protein
MPERIAKQMYKAMLHSTSVLLVPHQFPDGDALGSVTALMHLFKRLGIHHRAFCATSATEKLMFLPHAEHLTTDTAVWSEHIDLIIVLDSGDLRYAGIDEHIKQLPYRPMILNIDHHVTNEHFGDLNLVIPTASSTTQILYHFFEVNAIDIDRYMATCLLTGLLTDTGNFTNAATNTMSLTIAGELVKRGGDIGMIQKILFQNKTLNALKLWGIVLSRLAEHDTHKIVYSYVTKEDMEQHSVDDEEVEGLANFMNNLSDGHAALILREKENGILKGSFRTTREDIDVSEIAKLLGGGGHKKAAGFSAEGTPEEVLEQVWKVMEKQNQKT